jgi:hypothetical protein
MPDFWRGTPPPHRIELGKQLLLRILRLAAHAEGGRTTERRKALSETHACMQCFTGKERNATRRVTDPVDL